MGKGLIWFLVFALMAGLVVGLVDNYRYNPYTSRLDYFVTYNGSSFLNASGTFNCVFNSTGAKIMCVNTTAERVEIWDGPGGTDDYLSLSHGATDGFINSKSGDLYFGLGSGNYYQMTSGSFRPVLNGVYDLGVSSARWQTVFSERGNFSEDLVVNNSVLFVDGSAEKVGIGTTGPSQELDVKGQIQAFVDINAGGSGIPEIIVGNQGANQGKLGFQYRNAAANANPRGLFSFQPRLNADTGLKEMGQFEFAKKSGADSANFYLRTKRDGSANVEDRIHVNASTGLIEFQGENTNADVSIDGAGFYYDGSTDRVGIGTSAPSYQLHMIQNIDATQRVQVENQHINDAIYFSLKVNDPTPYNGILYESTNNHWFTGTFGTSTYLIRDHEAGTEPFKIENGTPDNTLYLDSIGRVGIGTATPWDDLYVAGTQTNAGALGGGGLILDSSNGAGIIMDRGTTSNDATLTYKTAGKIRWKLGHNSGYGGVEDFTFVNNDGVALFHIENNTGDVGIGTASPQFDLHIADSTYTYTSWTNDATGHGSDDGFVFGIGGTSAELYNQEAGSLSLGVDDDPTMLVIQADKDIAFHGTDLFIDESTSRVGIGTSTPDRTFEVEGASWPTFGVHESTNNVNFLFQAGTSLVYMGTQTDHPFKIMQGWEEVVDINTDKDFHVSGEDFIVDTNVLFVDASTNTVGIGTTNPTTTLHVNSSITNTVAVIESSDAIALFNVKDSGGFVSYAANDGDGQIIVNDGVTTSVHFDKDSKTGFGTTTPASKLHVVGADSDAIRLQSNGDNTYFFGRNGTDGSLQFKGTQASYTGYKFLDADGSIHFEVQRDGDFAVDTNTLFVDDSTNRVGIGTVTPATLLDVNGVVNVGGTTDGKIEVVSSAGRKLIIYPQDSNPYIHFGSSSNHDFAIVRNLVKQIVFSAAETQFGNHVKFPDGYNVEADTDTFFINGTSDLVGIGTTTPTFPLQIYHATTDTLFEVTSGDARAKFKMVDSSGEAYMMVDGDKASFGTDGNANTGVTVRSYGDDQYVGINVGLLKYFFTVNGNVSLNNTLYVTEGGRVGIGTTTPSSKLYVAGNTTIERFLHLGSSNSAVTSNGSIWATGPAVLNASAFIRARPFGAAILAMNSGKTLNFTSTGGTATLNVTNQYICDSTEPWTAGHEDMFLTVITSEPTDYLGATGVIADYVNSTCIRISVAAAGLRSIDDLTSMTYYVYKPPVFAALDRGDIHMHVGQNPDARFRLRIKNGTGPNGMIIEDIAGVDAHKSLTIDSDGYAFDGVIPLNILLRTSRQANNKSATVIFMEVDGTNTNDGSLAFIEANLLGSPLNAHVDFARLPPNLDHIIHVGTSDVLYPAYYESSNFTVNATSEATDTTLWENDNEYVYIGNDANFTSIGFDLGTVASQDLLLEYYYCNNTYGWETLGGVIDTTNGMTSVGTVSFVNPSNRGDCNQEYDGTLFSDKNNYTYVALKRTRNLVVTAPVENIITISGSSATFELKEDYMKLDPVDTAPVSCDATKLGAIYFDTSEDQMCVCNSVGWMEMDDTSAACT